MSADRDTTRIVRSWLRTDEHESADRVLGDVLAMLDATPQRRPSWPARRIADMNTFAKLATAIAAVVVAAVVGVGLLQPGGGPGVRPTPSPSPSSSPTPTAPPQPSEVAIAFPPAGAIEPGRHTLTESGIEFSLQVPDGWYSSGLNCSMCTKDAGWLEKGSGVDGDPGTAWMPIWHIDGVFADPCGHRPGPEATSATELAAAVAALPGTDVVTAPEDATVGGRPAKHVAIKVREDIDCAPGTFYMWYEDTGANDYRWATVLGQTNHVWIIEVEGGGRVWVEAETYKGSTPALEQEIQAMIDSIQFE